MPDALAAVTVPSLSKAGRSFCTEFERRARTDVFVLVDDRIAFPALDDHRHDLIPEFASLLRGFRLVLGGHREGVLLLARQLPLAGYILGRRAHVITVEGIPEPVLDHRVDHRIVAHLDAGPQMRAVRRQRHRFLAARDNDPGVAGGDLLHADRNRPQSRAADLVEAPGGGLLRQTRLDGSLPCRVLSLPGGQHLTEDDFIDFRSVDARTGEHLLDGDCAELMRGGVSERAIERADRRTGGACYYD